MIQCDSLMTSLTSREPPFSSSDSTLASKVREATRKKKSLTPSPKQRLDNSNNSQLSLNGKVHRASRWTPTRLGRHSPILGFDLLRQPDGFLFHLGQLLWSLKSHTHRHTEQWVTSPLSIFSPLNLEVVKSTNTQVLLGSDEKQQNAGRVVFLHGVLQPLPACNTNTPHLSVSVTQRLHQGELAALPGVCQGADAAQVKHHNDGCRRGRRPGQRSVCPTCGHLTVTWVCVPAHLALLCSRSRRYT